MQADVIPHINFLAITLAHARLNGPTCKASRG